MHILNTHARHFFHHLPNPIYPLHLRISNFFQPTSSNPVFPHTSTISQTHQTSIQQKLLVMPVSSLCGLRASSIASQPHLHTPVADLAQGINELYVTHATNIFTLHEENNTTDKISRSRIERQLLKAIDRSSLPTAWKVSWYDAVSFTAPNFHCSYTSCILQSLAFGTRNDH